MEKILYSGVVSLSSNIVLNLKYPEANKKIHQHLGPPNERICLHVLRKQTLVPEHVESRTLYSSFQPTLSQVRTLYSSFQSTLCLVITLYSSFQTTLSQVRYLQDSQLTNVCVCVRSSQLTFILPL